MLKGGVLCLCWLALASALRCPDGGLCEDGSTCCRSPSGRYSCCPLPHAVCCEDHKHCCFEGTVCDVKHSECLNKTSSVPWVEKVHAQSVSSFPMFHSGPEDNNYQNVCPDNTRCPWEYACLQTAAGSYGCCPLPQAVSCADGRHCCPEGYQCSEDGTSCTRSKELSGARAIICPDGESECPSHATCCPLPDGSWGCCPLVQAICCDDKKHCCPQGTRCDMQHSRCLSGTKEMPMWSKISARKRAGGQRVLDVNCPDGVSKCPDNTTCCQKEGGGYGCCPFPDAVCCTDHVHCCPSGTTCDLEHGMCSSAERQTPLQKKLPALLEVKEALTEGDVNCPDGVSKCPDNTTCCQKEGGGYGCCPFPDAVCCTDHLHCCPSGTTCDLEHNRCTSAERQTPLQKKLPALLEVKEALTEGDVNCPDGVSKCPDNTTCCQKEGGGYGCCPFPDAVCCTDHVHCCPSGTTCDLEHGMCSSAERQTPLQKKLPALLEVKEALTEGDVNCPDGVSKCPDNTTCCQKEGGGYGCCPFPDAVCCTDHVHCCPSGTTCDLEHGMCSSAERQTPLQKKLPALLEVKEALTEGDVNCPDGVSKCPDNTTCCQKEGGGYGCCPFPDAVCCTDHLHCCPSGTTCDLEHNTCTSAERQTPLQKKLPALLEVKEALTEGDVNCPDGVSKCPDNTTCCQKEGGGYGCCPFPDAVCCTDHLHCCPSGTTCDLEHNTCTSAERQTPLQKKLPALLEVKSVKCNDTAYCPHDTTCCKTAKGEWACCPFPKAVCCEDHAHCCPQGTTCDLTAGYCKSSTLSVPWLEKEPAKTGEPIGPGGEKGVKCDPETSCAAGTTCCQLPTGKWGCCPLVKGVCCSDHEHCCPQGYSCNIKAGTCEKRHEGVPWVSRSFPAVLVSPSEQRPRRDVQCDEEHRCPDSQTCCRTSSSSWGCCPFPKAVCCDDQKHCCPSGYSCDGAGGSCVRDGRLTWDMFFTERERALNHNTL
ncbi:progranulin-like isoform X2 [Lepisosteus oculatus]|uniref:progranulin-like isoform X2 n=1 Tax=Lepisosteus oculatus TaxID=7918 RepID=UPI003718F6CE